MWYGRRLGHVQVLSRARFKQATGSHTTLPHNPLTSVSTVLLLELYYYCSSCCLLLKGRISSSMQLPLWRTQLRGDGRWQWRWRHLGAVLSPPSPQIQYNKSHSRMGKVIMPAHPPNRATSVDTMRELAASSRSHPLVQRASAPQSNQSMPRASRRIHQYFHMHITEKHCTGPFALLANAI